MIIREFTVHFTTPAFLGNAEQNGQWRTPPFKHLLREWWRVAWAEANHYPSDVVEMRRAEARLFGAAADETGSRALIRLRLSRWDTGKGRSWNNDLKVHHPEVGRGGVAVGSQLYLGYGPLTYDKNSRGTKLKANAAIQAGEEAQLKLACPATDSALIDRALALADAFGALGGRARNGWGSLSLTGDISSGGEQPPLRAWQECLDREWAHAIGEDEQGALIWHTPSVPDWAGLMKTLAEVKIGLRTQFVFHSGKGASHPEKRHWLSYPVTNHSVKPWGGNSRLPNTLRFKVRKDDQGKFYGVIFHMPCLPPRQFRPDRQTVEQVWRQVHQYLDGQKNLQRSAW
jgi:CRISPR-associated protein Cmr1